MKEYRVIKEVTTLTKITTYYVQERKVYKRRKSKWTYSIFERASLTLCSFKNKADAFHWIDRQTESVKLTIEHREFNS